MKIAPTLLDGLKVIEIDRLSDERGFFARTFDEAELSRAGIVAAICECSASFNTVRGTLRGLHFQAAPHEEDKFVRCTAGAIFDVAVDIRPSSPTYRGWYGTELSAENRRTLFIPKGFAHGFITLNNAAEVYYMMTMPFVPGFVRTIRWDDPELAISWPSTPAVISARDRSAPTLSDFERA